jgi:hypothetical protein
MGRRDRLTLTRNEKLKPLRVVARCFDTDRSTFDGAGMGALGAGPDGVVEIGQRQETLVIGARKPFGRNAADPFTARNIDFEAGSARLTGGSEGVHSIVSIR